MTNTGGGVLGPPVSLSVGSGPRRAAVALVNSDSLLDLAAALSSNQVAVLRSQGNGTFDTPVLLGTGKQPGGILPVDLNLDGAIDLAVGCEPINALSTLVNQSAVPGLALAGIPSLGNMVTAVLTGSPGEFAALFASPGTGMTPLPPLGVIGLDTTATIQLATWTLPASGAVTLPLLIPAGATNLIGQTAYFQGLILQSLTPLAGALTPVRSATVLP